VLATLYPDIATASITGPRPWATSFGTTSFALLAPKGDFPMSLKRRKEAAKQAVLGELELLAGDRHPQNQTLIARFARCTDYQNATRLLTEALGATGRWRKRSPLSAPPGWLPPLT
jgi:hypothetical protein